MATLVELLGDQLILSGGDAATAVPLESVVADKKQVILYFSARWCPPCRGFTPLLSSAYEGYEKRIKNENVPKEIELIFVSRDRDEDAFKDYHKEMTFPALPYDSALSQKLMAKYEVNGIPTLVAIDGNGDVVQKDTDFRSLVSSHGAEAFPLTPERVSQLGAIQEEKKKEMFQKIHNGEIPFAAKSKDGSSTMTLKELLESSEHVGILLGDGDYSDGCYQAAKAVMEKVNKEVANRCSVVYMGGNLYNFNSDHCKLTEKFDYFVSEVSAELIEAVECILGENKSFAPQLILLRKGTGLCGMDGTCEELGVPVVVSTDPGLSKMRTAGPTAFPWDEAAMNAFEAKEKARVEEVKKQLKNMEFLTKETEDGPTVVRKDGDQRSLEELLFVGDEDAVIGLYFSAHWCPPCRMFTPMLVKCYEKVKEAGKKFEIVFVSSDSSKDEFVEYHKSMVTNAGDQFLALDYDRRELKSCLSKIFEVRGIPTLVLLKPDGTILSREGVQDVAGGGAESFPWDKATLERVKMEKEAAEIQKEKDDENAQVAAGVPVVKRLIGERGSIKQDVEKKTLEFGSFSTAGAPGLFANSGVIYYEIDILEQDGIPQLGFSLKDGLESLEVHSGDGVGDNKSSWGVDGVRNCKWNNGSIPFPGCSWDVGDTIGLAANVGGGMIAVSKNGCWEGDGCGIVFRDQTIKQGVYPCFTGARYKMEYRVGNADMKHAPPADSFWDETN